MTYNAQARLDHLGLHHGVLEPRTKGSSGWFSWVLVVSLSVNVAFIAFLVFQMQDGVLWFEVETREPIASVLPDVSVSDSLKEELVQLWGKSDEELIGALDNETVVANGYRLQELALAVLRARGFQVEDPLRPLGAWPQPMSAFSWAGEDGKRIVLPLFSNIGIREIQAVRAFLRETAVPFTAEGIVRKLKEGNDSVIMKEALFRTDEWTTFSRVFNALPDEERLVFCKDIGGEAFSSIVDWGHSSADQKEIGPFVVALFAKVPSTSLAEIVAKNYADHVVLQAPDDTVLLLYSHLSPQSEAGVRLAMRLLHGQRKLPVWQASQAYLARAASMPTLSSMNRDQVLAWLQHVAHPQKTQVVMPSHQESISPKNTENIVPKTQMPTQSVAPKQQAPSSSVKQQTQSSTPKAEQSVTPKAATPAAAVSTRVATRQLQPYRTYVVRKGDTLWSIARRFNVDVEKLKYLNGLKGATLPPGKVLRIPH